MRAAFDLNTLYFKAGCFRELIIAVYSALGGFVNCAA